jgi:hypothetical protein
MIFRHAYMIAKMDDMINVMHMRDEGMKSKIDEMLEDNRRRDADMQTKMDEVLRADMKIDEMLEENRLRDADTNAKLDEMIEASQKRDEDTNAMILALATMQDTIGETKSLLQMGDVTSHADSDSAWQPTPGFAADPRIVLQ